MPYVYRSGYRRSSGSRYGRSSYGGRSSSGRRRKSSSGRNSSAIAIAREALSLAKVVSRREKAVKQLWPVTNQPGGWVPIAGTSEGNAWIKYILNRVPQGIEEHDRIGDQIVGVGLHIRGTVELHGSPESFPFKRRFRVLVVRLRGDPLGDAWSLIAPFTLFNDDLFTDGGTSVTLPLHDVGTAMYRREEMGNFHIMKDEILCIDDEKNVVQFDWGFKVPYKTSMIGSTTTTTDVFQNSIFLMAIYLDTSTPPTVGEGSARLVFQSNYTFTTA